VSFSQGNRLEGTNYNLGLLWRWPTWSLGITRRTAFHGDYTYSVAFESSKMSKTVAAPFTTGLHWPSTTGVGFAFRPADHWVVAADLLTTAWSQARYLSTREALNGLNFFDMAKGNRTPDATQFHAGIERVLLLASGKVIPLGLGYSREPQPVTDRNTGQQRVMQGVSLGSGVKMGAYTLDVGYRYGWGRRFASQYLDPEQVLSDIRITTRGRETLREHRLDASFIYRFERGPVLDLLHYLFVGD
jgi:long-subunit fatty acid transport protein